MFTAIDPEVGYHLTLKIIRGVALKVLTDYPLATSSHYTTSAYLKPQQFADLSQLCQGLHTFLVSFSKKKTPDNNTSITHYWHLCENALALVAPETPQSAECLHHLSAIHYVVASYQKILSRMLSRCSQPFSQIFEEICSQYLVAAIIHHESAISNGSLSEKFLMIDKIYTTLLCEK